MPIDELKKALKDLANDELDRSDKLHGDFHGIHEAFGIILEEVDEARDFIAGVRKYVSIMRKSLRKGSVSPGHYQSLYENAINAAYELIQVAAMGLKGKRMVVRKTSPFSPGVDGHMREEGKGHAETAHKE